MRDFLRWLPAVRPEWRWTVYLLPPASRDFPDPEAHPRMTVEHVSLGDSEVGRTAWLWLDLPRRLRRIGADVLFSFANIGALRGNTPCVTYVHQALAFRRKASESLPFREFLRFSAMRFLILKGARASRHIIVQTEDMRRRMATAAPDLEGCITVIPGSVSPPESGEPIRAEKQRQIESAGSPRLLYVAAPMPHKNHLTLIRALPEVVARFPETTLFLTLDDFYPTSSNGPTARNAQVEALRQATAQGGVENNIVWLGSLNRSEVQFALRNCSLAVVPSTEESFGLPLAEAIVAQCPLAASNLPYAHEVAGSAALYFDPLDPHSIASVLKGALGRPEVLADLRIEQAKRAPIFAPANIAEAVAACLEAAAGGQRPG